MNPILSILLPVFNSANYVAETIDSVLKQSFSQFTFYIYNDASTDNSETEILKFKDPRILYRSLPENIGYVKVLNTMLQQVKTPFIARIDSDDVCHLKRFEKQIKILMDNPEVGICGSAANLIEVNNVSVDRIWYQPEKHEDIIVKGFAENPIIHPSAIFRKELVDTIGFYNQLLMPSEDLDYWLRASFHYHLYNIQEPLINYRIHPGQISRLDNRVQMENARTIHLRFISRMLNCDEKLALVVFERLTEKRKLKVSEKWLLSRKVISSRLPFQAKRKLRSKLL